MTTSTRILSALALGLMMGIALLELGTRLLISPENPLAPERSADADANRALLGIRPNLYVPSHHPPMTLELRPDPRVVPGASDRVVFHINEFGFRNQRMSSREKPSGEVRIFAVGGSTTECLYLSEEASWPERLHARLSKSFPDINVINAGRSADHTRDHIALVTQRLVPYEPDILVFLVGINDLWLQTDPGYSIVRDGTRSHAVVHQPGLRELVQHRLADISHLFRVGLQLRDRMRRTDEQGNPFQDVHGHWIERARAWRREATEGEALQRTWRPSGELVQNLRTLVAAARVHGAEAVLVTQPVIWGAAPGDWESRLWVTLGQRRHEPDDMWWALEQLNDGTRAVAAELDVPLIDLARALPKDPAYFYDDDHFTETGAAEVARILAAGIMNDPALTAILGRAAAPRSSASPPGKPGGS